MLDRPMTTELVQDADAPASEEASDLVVAIISYAIIGVMVLGWTAFAFWVAQKIHLNLVAIEQGLEPVGRGRFSGFAWFLHETIGLWPTTFLFFAGLMSPIPGIYFELRRQKQKEAAGEPEDWS